MVCSNALVFELDRMIHLLAQNSAYYLIVLEPGTPPTDLTLMPVESESGTSVQLNWQPPTQPNGELTGEIDMG